MSRLLRLVFAMLIIVAAVNAEARDYDEIKKSGVLRVLTVYPAEPQALPREMSPEDYETSLLESFAKAQDLKIEMLRVQTFAELIKGLENEHGDLAASILTITPERQKLIKFTTPILFTVEQLVSASGNKSFKELSSLAGHSIHVQPGTSYEKSAEALAKEIKGLTIKKTPPSIEQDEVFQKVASGDYEYTIADECYVRSFLSYNDSIRDVYTFPEKKQIAWGLPKDSAKLETVLNEFIRKSVPAHQLRSYKEDLSELKERGYIRILTRNNPYSYYIQNGVLMGFEYELAREFAKKTGLHPIFVVPPEWNDLIPWLQEGRGEIVAACMTVTEKRQATDGVSFCAPYASLKEQIIGRKNEPVKALKELSGRTLAVRKSSSYWESAQKLKEAGVDIKLVAAPDDFETYEILDQIEVGNYDLTLCDDNIAAVELKFRPALAALATLSKEKQYGWLVRDTSPELKAEIDKFFEKAQKAGTFNFIFAKYFKNASAPTLARENEISEDCLKYMSYATLIKKYSANYRFHWCLIAAQILQESRFNPDAISSSGARGLMQIMPAAAEHMGFKSIEKPEENIHAGTKYLYTLREKAFFSHVKPFDRLCFALASYNGGLGHLLDARELAAREKLNPDVWLDNVEKAYALLGQEKYYKRAKYGACRTREINGYVRNIILYYRMYLREHAESNPQSALPPDAMP